MNFEKWEYKESNLPKDHVEKEKALDELKNKFLEELQSNLAATAWLEQFDEKSRASFIERYTSYKVSFVRNSDIYIHNAEQVPELKFREKTEEVLSIILQKKLFNLQCQWRAELITLPDIRISIDFWYWASNIRNCPFIDPVTDTELEIMQRFVQTDDFEAQYVEGNLWHWQHYSSIKSQCTADEDSEIAAWYNYYDTYMGTSAFLLLPDIRGQKEDVYYKAYSEKERKDREDAGIIIPPHVPAPYKEYLMHSVHRFYELACECDSPYFTTLFKSLSDEEAMGDALEESEGEADEYVYKLKNIPDLPPVRGGLSWRQALRYCYEDYLKSIIAHDLPTVCEEYHLYRSMGFIYAATRYTLATPEEFKAGNDSVERLLAGREALGEPRDFDF